MKRKYNYSSGIVVVLLIGVEILQKSINATQYYGNLTDDIRKLVPKSLMIMI